MRVESLGDRGLIVRDLAIPAWSWAENLNRQSIPGLIEAYASYDTVGLEIEPETFHVDSLPKDILEFPIEGDEKILRIPVCYSMGEDIASVAEALSLTEEQVVQIHSSSVYRCEAVGFCPGFPYLSGLDERLWGIPRRPSPRTAVEPGSVAITGSQAGIYPIVRPGGWAILGRTPLRLVDVQMEYFPIRAGDLIRFEPIERQEFESLKGRRL